MNMAATQPTGLVAPGHLLSVRQALRARHRGAGDVTLEEPSGRSIGMVLRSDALHTRKSAKGSSRFGPRDARLPKDRIEAQIPAGRIAVMSGGSTRRAGRRARVPDARSHRRGAEVVPASRIGRAPLFGAGRRP